MDKLKRPILPKMLNDSVMLVDAKAWNQLLEYIEYQTNVIENISKIVETTTTRAYSNSEAIVKISEILKENIEQ